MAMPAFHLHGENPWKLGLGFLVLTLFFGLGLAHVFRPGYFYRRSGIRKGGEMLTEFNLIGVQMVGLVVALFALGVMYDIVQGCSDRESPSFEMITIKQLTENQIFRECHMFALS